VLLLILFSCKANKKQAAVQNSAVNNEFSEVELFVPENIGCLRMRTNGSCKMRVINATSSLLQFYYIGRYGELDYVRDVFALDTMTMNVGKDEFWVLGTPDGIVGAYQNTFDAVQVVVANEQLNDLQPFPLYVKDRTAKHTPSGGELSALQQAYDVLHMDISLEIDTEKRYVLGSNELTVNAIAAFDTFELDLDTVYTIQSVLCEQEQLKWKFQNGKLWVRLSTTAKQGETIRVRVNFEGAPRVAANPPYVGGYVWALTEECQPWISTTCQIDGADLLFPCKDHQSDEADSLDIRITLPSNLNLITNGILVDRTKTGNDQLLHHWKVSNPINNYGISFYAAVYTTQEKVYQSVSGLSFPIGYAMLPETELEGKHFLSEMIKHMDFIEGIAGTYPWAREKYMAVQSPYIGMEHQTATAYGNGYKFRNLGYDHLHFHELCHEWFGNMLTVTDWSDFWIHETFPYTLEGLYVNELGGDEAYHSFIQKFKRNQNLEMPVITKVNSGSQDIYAQSTNYFSKSIFLMHALRYLEGKEFLAESIHRFAYPDPQAEKALDGSHCRMVNTQDYLTTVNVLSDKDYSWLFEMYLRQTELPVLDQKIENGVLYLEWKTPDNLPFPMPVQIVDGEKQLLLEMPNNKGKVNLSSLSQPTIDPLLWILKNETNHD